MIEIDRFFDIETSEWTKFAIGGVITAGTEEYFDTTSESELFWHLIEPASGTTWSWNGGKFDMLWLLDCAKRFRWDTKLDLTCKLSTAGPRITSLEINGVTFRDAVALCPFSLAKAAVIAGLTLSKDTGLDCICSPAVLHENLASPTEPSVDCGGYCAITPELKGMLPDKREKFRKYLYLDNLAGLRTMEAVIAEANRCEYELTGTIGGSSFKTAKTKLGIEPAGWSSSSEYQFARSGYYGGRVEVFQPTAPNGFAYDINSAYPAALVRTALPTGEKRVCEADVAGRAYQRGKEGIFTAECNVPLDMHIPPLPIRLASGRVAFPIGEFSGSWTALELREAESLGCTVKITGGLVWADSEIVFKDYMAEVWKNRADNRDNKGLYQWHKWFANSLTGKLAERPEKEKIMMYPDMTQLKTCEGGKCKSTCKSGTAEFCASTRCCDLKHRPGGCGAWRMLDLKGDFYLSPFYKISDCAHVQWAAYLTAAARIQLAQQLRADGQGGKSAVYCDTDSVYATATRSLDIGPELGQWGYDGEYTDWLAVAPKLYRYLSDKGKQVIKAKGLSDMNRRDFDHFVQGGKVTSIRGVKSFKSACKDISQRLFVRKNLSRTNKSDGVHFGSRILRADGKTYPLTLAELIAWERAQQRGEKAV
tara:strand:- start:19022 stop:20968 length:1947 start_codon:yes stop_codon:yes gene_type:complete